MADDEVREGEEDEWLYGESVSENMEMDIKVTPLPVPPPVPYIKEGIRIKATKRKLGEVGAEDEGDGRDQSEDRGEREERNEDTLEGQGEEDEGDPDAPSEDLRDNEDISENDEDDDDSEDDGVQVVIGDIKGGQNTSFGSAPVPQKRVGPPPDKKGKFAAEDFEATGTINGVPAQDFSLDSIDEKPWRKPGADITDYFNYGFTEETWRAYCDRQKRMRFESGATYSAIAAKGSTQHGNNTDSKSGIVFPKKFNNAQGGRKEGMGQGVRREEPRENTIQVRVVMTADRREYGRKPFENMNMGPPMIPPPPFNMNLPPPPFPPPPDFMGGDFFNHPPPGYYQEEEPSYEEQQWMDSQWEMGIEGSGGMGPSSLVVPLTKVAVVPPPPGESGDDDSLDIPSTQKNETNDK